MRLTKVKDHEGHWVDLPTWGTAYGVARDAIATAVDLEHYCDDASCDIAEAARHGYVLVAAERLRGATETYTLDAVLAFYWPIVRAEWGGIRHGAESSAEWLDWLDHFDRYAFECDCGAYTFGSDHWTPSTCGNCLADLFSWESGELMRWIDNDTSTYTLPDQLSYADDDDDWRDLLGSACHTLQRAADVELIDLDAVSWRNVARAYQ